MVTGMIAAALYGNIGIKIIYINIIEDMFKGPAITTRKGRWIWTGLVPLYWALACTSPLPLPIHPSCPAHPI